MYSGYGGAQPDPHWYERTFPQGPWRLLPLSYRLSAPPRIALAEGELSFPKFVFPSQGLAESHD